MLAGHQSVRVVSSLAHYTIYSQEIRMAPENLLDEIVSKASSSSYWDCSLAAHNRQKHVRGGYGGPFRVSAVTSGKHAFRTQVEGEGVVRDILMGARYQNRVSRSIPCIPPCARSILLSIPKPAEVSF